MQKILCFGGSFDPPHLGHAALLNAAAKRLRPDQILIIPAYHAPLKAPAGAAAAERLHMIRSGLLPSLAAPWRGRARVELGEINSRRRVYTVETLSRLKRLFPGCELHFVVGSDAAAGFIRWKQPAILKNLCSWWSGARPAHSPQRSVPAFFRRLPGVMPDIGSTEIRSRLALGQEIDGLVSAPVAAYIRKKKLYHGARIARLRGMLARQRFEHSVAVARLCEQLARRWGLNPEKALTAGLLHDCGRSLPAAAMPAYARRRRLPVPGLSEISRRHPLLCHAYISADLARIQFGVSDPEILSAIRKHTLGGRPMSRLDRLLYAADACSEDRNYPEAETLRALAFDDLETAFSRCVSQKMRHALSRGDWLHPMTLNLWNSLQDS